MQREGVWFILGWRTARERKKERRVEGWFTWWENAAPVRPLRFSLIYSILASRFFFLHRFTIIPVKKSEPINRHWQHWRIDVLNSQDDIRYRLWMFLESIRARDFSRRFTGWKKLNWNRLWKINNLEQNWKIKVSNTIYFY